MLTSLTMGYCETIAVSGVFTLAEQTCKSVLYFEEYVTMLHEYLGIYV